SSGLECSYVLGSLYQVQVVTWNRLQEKFPTLLLASARSKGIVVLERDQRAAGQPRSRSRQSGVAKEHRPFKPGNFRTSGQEPIEEVSVKLLHHFFLVEFALNAQERIPNQSARHIS